MNLSLEAMLAFAVLASALSFPAQHAESRAADALLLDVSVVVLKGYFPEAQSLHDGNAQGMQELANDIARETGRCVQFESNGHSTRPCAGTFSAKELFFFSNEIFFVTLRAYE